MRLVRSNSDERCRGGFTYVDLLVTVLVMGILAAVAVPKFAATLHQARIKSAAQRIAADIAYARERAISTSTTVTVEFATASESYTIPLISDLNRPSQAYTVELNAPPYEALLVGASLGGDADVQFDQFGNPDSGGVITVASGGYQQTVTIDPVSGRATIP